MVTMGGWFQQRSGLEKSLLFLAALLIFTLFALIIVIVTSQGGNGSSSSEGGTNCFSKECIQTAGQMLSRMSEKSNPCTNFYEYACGSYDSTSNQIRSVAQSSRDSVYSSIRNLFEDVTNVDDINAVRVLYRSCMEFEGLHSGHGKPDESLKSIMAEVGAGTWPVIDTYFDVDLDLPLDERLVGLLFIGVPVAYRIDIVPDPRANGSFIMKLSPGGPYVAGRLENDVRGDAQLKTHLLSSFLLLGAPYNRALTDVDDILSVENKYAAIEQNKSMPCDSTEAFLPEESLRELNRLLPGTEWSVLLTSVQKAAGLSRPFAVQIYCKEKIKKYISELRELSERSAYNYLGWRFFAAFSSHILPAMRRSQTEDGEEYPRWKDCVRLLEKLAAPSLARALTLHEIQNATVEKVMKVIGDTKRSMESLLSSTRWLNEEQHFRVQQQLKHIDVTLPFVRRPSMNELSFLRLSEVNIQNYTTIVIELQRRLVTQTLKKLNPFQEHSLKAWKLHLIADFMSSENSYASISFDKIQEPYFTIDGPEWINYGGLGVFTARELIKALLSQNFGVSLEDETTLWDVWFSNREASSCLLNSISSRFGLVDDSELIKRKWIKELFLDASSLEIAFQSSTAESSSEAKQLPGFSSSEEQLFFIAYAQTFCSAKKGEASSRYIPSRDRLNAAVSNSRAFKKAFSCDVSSSTCDIWS